MEDLFPLLVVIGIILSFISKSNKEAKKRPAGQGQPSRQTASRQPQARQQAKPRQTAARPAALTVEMPAPRQTAQPAPIAPTVHVTRHTDDIFEGSMAMASTEGYDPCHEHELEPSLNPCELAPEEETTAAAPGISLEWNGNALVKAMVMQEVLTRPCDRVRR